LQWYAVTLTDSTHARWPSTDTVIDEGGLKLGCVRVGRLGRGASRTPTKGLVIPPDVAPGVYHLGALPEGERPLHGHRRDAGSITVTDRRARSITRALRSASRHTDAKQQD